eukprot:TRINITY_DN2272_c0_g1_i1.p1 TRINITY_DN2272_c0_g1~~TRINITY_DN2272_c0_g1_i1.p1  ORF type:complete len:151 (-),score=27.45 TRINITY_DN2272_c0_g1_i1:83-535(-)
MEFVRLLENMLKGLLAIVVISALLVVNVDSLSLTGQVRNQFSTELTLKSYILKSGVWDIKPVATIPRSQDYIDQIWQANGTDSSGIVGQVVYQSSDHYATATFEFDTTKDSYTANVGPSPFIGGVGTHSGTDAIVAQYWTHQMCKVGQDC